MSDLIELRVKIDDNGKTTVVDQHGRKLKGVTAVTRKAEYGEVTTLVIHAFEYVNGEHVLSRAVDNA